jgi:hypothetical protein
MSLGYFPRATTRITAKTRGSIAKPSMKKRSMAKASMAKASMSKSLKKPRQNQQPQQQQKLESMMYEKQTKKRRAKVINKKRIETLKNRSIAQGLMAPASSSSGIKLQIKSRSNGSFALKKPRQNQQQKQGLKMYAKQINKRHNTKIHNKRTETRKNRSIAQGSLAQGSLAQGSLAQGSLAQGSMTPYSMTTGELPAIAEETGNNNSMSGGHYRKTRKNRRN